MDWKLVDELAKVLNLPPLVVAYLVWLGVENFRERRRRRRRAVADKKQFDAAFKKVRALQRYVRQLAAKSRLP